MYMEDCTNNGINNGVAIFTSVMLIFFVLCFCLYLCYDFQINQAYYQKSCQQDYWNNRDHQKCCSRGGFRQNFNPGRDPPVTMLYAQP